MVCTLGRGCRWCVRVGGGGAKCGGVVWGQRRVVSVCVCDVWCGGLTRGGARGACGRGDRDGRTDCCGLVVKRMWAGRVGL